MSVCGLSLRVGVVSHRYVVTWGALKRGVVGGNWGVMVMFFLCDRL